tara:strand:+ start:26790 stop:26981 length:192 start_codon:yes stop_codon:yes gene_type:complete
VDPLAWEFPWNSIYTFAENDVIRNIELEGLEKLIGNNIDESVKSMTLVIKKDIQILNTANLPK